ncbi:MAG TPA: hypothetical protein VEC99_06610 [Clostridia bacterium]|nr:hypothetical protein [Clostridia bacterium]
MNNRFTVIETNLNRAELRWKGLRLLRYTSVLGILVCLGILGLGAAILAGWIVYKPVAVTILSVLGGLGLIAWVVVLIKVMAGAPERRWLAATIERFDKGFLDRLNTLVFLEQTRSGPQAESFTQRIARQTQEVFARKNTKPPFSAASAWAWLAGLVALLVATVYFNQSYAPWSRLLTAQKNPLTPTGREVARHYPTPPTNSVEQNETWGEIRITEPGNDLKVTKVDVVPLQIEAAANRPLQDIGWFSTVNGKEETAHQLPPPPEPRYAVYQPTFYLDELNLSDWDVVTYYARANTEQQDNYASEVYFLEVRPFREDIMKLPGGEGGKPYQTLSEISSLINRQQHVIRQTHQHIQRPPPQEHLQAQDRKKLADAEKDLGDSARHLYAKMAAEMENQPIGEALDNLAKAEKSLENASNLLQQNTLKDAQNQERAALSELIAARKMFQKAVSDNPNAFQDSEQNENQEESPPVADAANKLNQMAEFRDEAKAAQDFVQKSLEQQKDLAQRSKTGPRSQLSQLSNEQQQLQQALQDFQQQHPRAFKGSEEKSQQAQQAMSKAADSLQKRSDDSGAATEQAANKLEQFNQALQRKTAEQQLADAYKLKQMLDQQIQTLDRRSKPDSGISDTELEQTAKQTQKTLDQLKQTVNQEATRGSFGQPLRDALSDQNKADLQAKLNQLMQAQAEAAKQQLAGEAKAGLDNVSKAFGESQPKSMQMARQKDALQTPQQGSFDRGMAELDSLLKQLQNNRQIPPADQKKQGQQALYDLQTGMRSQFGSNEEGNQILLKLEGMLKGETPLDVGDLKKLMDELQRFSVQITEKTAKKENQPELANINPAQLPPAYRGRIQKYFQKLSEQ